MIDTKNIKLSVYAVLGEGLKLMFDVPKSLQHTVGVNPGDTIDLDQLVLWHEIDKAYHDYKDCQDVNAIAKLQVPARLAKRLDMHEDGSVRVRVLLQFLQGNYVDKDMITPAERADLMDAIFNPNRAAKRKPGHK